MRNEIPKEKGTIKLNLVERADRTHIKRSRQMSSLYLGRGTSLLPLSEQWCSGGEEIAGKGTKSKPVMNINFFRRVDSEDLE